MNGIVMMSHEIFIHIKYILDPLDVAVDVNDVVTEHDDVDITCNTNGGNPDYVERYEWELTSKYADQGLQREFECEERNCTIRDISPEYAGDYTCTAINNWGGNYYGDGTGDMVVECE